MALVTLTVDVYCNRSEGEPGYRVYVDDEMLTERNWLWPGWEVFIRENIEVDVESGTHKLEVRELGNDNVFFTKDATMNGVPFLNNNGIFTV